jgi:hypothetical protein
LLYKDGNKNFKSFSTPVVAEQSFGDLDREVEATISDIEHRAETHWTCREAKIHREATTLCLISDKIDAIVLPLVCLHSEKKIEQN